MYLETKDCKLYYEKYGTEKKTILFLPGWGETKNTFFKWINEFKEKYTVYIMDYPGFGNSPFPEKDLTIYDYSLLIKDLLEKENIKNPIIIAHSFGGRIATILTSVLKVNIDKMIFIDVAGIKPKKKLKTRLKEKIYKLKKYLIKKLYKKTREKKLEALRKKYASNDYKVLPPSMFNTFKNIVNEDLKKYYKEIKSEVLLIWGAKDIDTPIQDAIYIKKEIENSALIVFPDGTHFSYLEYSDAMYLIIKSFIDEENATM